MPDFRLWYCWALQTAAAFRSSRSAQKPTSIARGVVTLDASNSADLDLFVGIDLNNDGLDSLDEQRCASNGSGGSQLCLLTQDSATRNWIVAQNYAASQTNAADQTTINYAVGAQNSSQNTALGARVPSTIAAQTPFDALLTSNFSALQARKLVAVLDIGNSLDPSAVGSSVLVFSRAADMSLFKDGFEQLR